MAGVAKLVTTGAQGVVPPEETWARVAPLLQAMPITRVAELTGPDVVGIPVFRFATVEGFRVSARSFYLYDKAHPGAGPLVLQTAAAGDGACGR
ncbi:hypothetical protein ABT150_50310 [Streptomyces mirabilis]|uniref:hypothetical protein n=1 Tax=Streptomyces mirabilis TaxID=68239 RepID=UPI00331C684C